MMGPQLLPDRIRRRGNLARTARACAIVSALLCVGLLASGCGDGQDTSDEADEEDEEDEVASSLQSLADNRSVQIDVVDAVRANGLPVGSQRLPVKTMDKFLVGACYWELSELFGVRSKPFPNFAAAASKPAEESIWLDTFYLNSECTVNPTNVTPMLAPTLPPLADGIAKAYKGWVTAWLWGCMGDLALSIAENPSGSSVLALEADKGFTIKSGPDKDAIMRVPAPSATDRASWYLLAADHHQIATTLATSLFDRNTADGTTCPTTTWTDQFKTSAGDTTTVGLTIATVASHSLQRMIEASEKAQQYIVAAAEAHTSSSADVVDATTQLWRAAVDSRLEGAATYVRVADTMFDGRGFKRLYRMSNGEQFIITTDPSAAPAGFIGAEALDGWAAPTATDGATLPLITWRFANNVYETYAAVGVTEAAPPAGGTLVRREGYVYTASATGRKGLVVKQGTVARGSVTVNVYYETLTDDEINSVRFPNAVAAATGFVPTKLQAGDYPVYAVSPVSSQDKSAESLIRTYMLNPRQTGAAIATDLLAALNKRYRVPGQTATPLGTNTAPLLNSLFKTNDTAAAQRILEAAGQRVVAKAALLGQSIIPVPGTTAPINHTVPPERGGQPPASAFLYAMSAGSTSSGNHLDNPTYARRGVAHTVDYFRRAYAFRNSDSIRLPPAVMSLLGAANAYANTFADADFVVTASCFTGAYTDGCELRLVNDSTGPQDVPGVSSQYDLWADVAGLECAVRGNIAGVVCNPEDYHFGEAGFTKTGANSTGEPWGVSVLQARASLIRGTAYGLPANQAPTTLAQTIPVFLTRKAADGSNKPIFGFYPGKVTGMYPLMGDGLRGALDALLAADPTDPEAGASTCAGIPRNANVLLEDELIDVELDDRYDQSFRYYLDEARSAATEADLLGKELVAQGLAMDERAETALEQLEDMCGGSINLAPLEKKACSSYNCDMVAMLKDPALTLTPDLQTQLEGARRCFGIGGTSEPIWVAVGDQPLCAWRYAPGKVPDPKYRPCGACPVGAQCPAQCPQLLELGQSGAACVVPEADAAPFPILDTLGVAATRRDFYAEPEEDTRLKWLIARYLAEREKKVPASLGIPDAKKAATAQWEEWVTDHRLSPIAQQLGYFQDFDNANHTPNDLLASYALITKGGDTWLDLNQLFTAWDLAAQTYDPYLGRDAQHTGAMPWPCGAVDKTVAALCDTLPLKPYDAAWPLVCGHMCGVYENGGVDRPRTAALRADLANRITRAIDALKQLTGESFENVVRVSQGITILASDIVQNPPQVREIWYNVNDGPPPRSEIRGLMLGDTQAKWVNAFLFGDFEYAGAINGAPYYLGSPPPETGGHYGRCIALGDGLRCDYVGSPKTDVAPPGVWESNLCVHGQSLSETNVTGESQTDTTTSLDDTGCGKVRAFLEGKSKKIEFSRTVTTDSKVSKWCVGVYKRTKTEHLVRDDDIEEDPLDERFTVCFGKESDAQAWADEVNDGVLDALAAGDQPLCGTAGVLETNSKNGARLCGMVGTLDPLGITNMVAGWLKDVSVSIRAYEPEFIVEDPDGTTNKSEGTVPGLAFLDSLQLAHLVAIEDQGTCDTLWASAPQITSVADFADVRKQMECSADRVELQLSRMALGGVPRDLVDALLDASKASVDLAQRGTYGETLLKLVTASQNFGRQRDVVVQAMRNLGLEFDMGEAKLKAAQLNLSISDIDAYINALEQGINRRELDSVKTRAEIDRLRLRQSISSYANQAAMSALAAMPSFSCGISEAGCSMSFSPGAALQSVVQMAHSAEMIDIEASVGQLQGHQTANDVQNTVDRGAILDEVARKISKGKELNDIEKKTILLDLQQKVLDKADLINGASSALNESYGEVLTLLAQIDQIRAKSRRAAAKALLLENDDMGKQYNVNITMRATMNTLKVRYERARDAAIRSAFLARRAVEQKLGIELSSIKSDVGWVQAPGVWADSVCTLSGINYSEIRDNTTTMNDAGRSLSGSVVVDANGRHYADAFVGEYISKLEQFVEAYRSSYPFQDADDTMVVSLRDELLGITAACDARGHNELYQTGAVVGDAWMSDCVGSACVTAAPASDGPFGCASEADDQGAGNEGNPCDTTGGASSVKLRFTGIQGATTPVSWTAPAASFYDVEDLAGLSAWVRPEECTTTSCPGAVPGARGAVAPSGATLPSVTTDANGVPWFVYDNADRLNLEATSVSTSAFTFSTVLTAPNSPYGWYQDVPQPNGSVTRYLLYIGGQKVWFERISNATSATPNSQLTSSLPLAAGPHIITLRNSLKGLFGWVDGQLFMQDTTFLPALSLNTTVGGMRGSVGGQVGESILFNRALTYVELSKVQRYLAEQHSITTLTTERPQATDGLVSWFRADNCIGPSVACDDLADPLNTITRTGTLTLNPAGIGGKPSLDTPGTSWTAMTAAGPAMTESATMTLSAVVAQNSWANGADVAYFAYSIQDQGWELIAPSSTSTIGFDTDWMQRDISGRMLSSPITKANGAPAILTVRIGTDLMELMLDGVAVARAPVPQGANGSQVTQNLLPYIFAARVGKTSEILLFDRALTNTELTGIHRYLSDRYGIATAVVRNKPSYKQVVTSPGGRYWLSWYENTLCTAPPSVLASVEFADGSKDEVSAFGCVDKNTVATSEAGRPSAWLRNGWSRRYGSVVVDKPGNIGIGFTLSAVMPTAVAPTPAQYPTPAAYQTAFTNYRNSTPEARLAAPQLELIEADVSVAPRPFFATDDDLLAPQGECPDWNGDAFRNSELWTRQCEYYCPFGTGQTCADFADLNSLPRRCYRQISFAISQEDIEAGRLIPQGGFALGNFNYRHNTFAVNFVGTSVKACSTSAQPAACYAANFLQYTIHHDGPYSVRNYDGDIYYAPLNPGRVQQAKGLSAERYITNPISGADRSLLTDYWRDEFRGRPIEGNYTLRVYDEAIKWENLEDLQIVYNYRYWTRAQ